MRGVGQELVQNKRMNKALERFLHIVRRVEVLPEAYRMSITEDKVGLTRFHETVAGHSARDYKYWV